MTYATLIQNLRNQVGDLRRRVHVDWTGNASDTVFQMPQDTFPVYDVSGTYVVKVNAVTMTENTDYTLDKETGTLVFAVAPGNNIAVLIDSSAVYLTNDSWLTIINNVIYSLGDDFWKEFTDIASFTATANMLSLSLVAGQPNCIAVYDFQRRTSTSNDWAPVANDVNWRYDRDNNIIYIGVRDAFGTTGELLRIRGLKKYTLGTATSDTLDVQDQYLTILEFGGIARYWRYRYKSVVELVSKNVQENTRTPLQELIMLSDRAERDYERERGKLKPMKPAFFIPVKKEGAGKP